LCKIANRQTKKWRLYILIGRGTSNKKVL